HKSEQIVNSTIHEIFNDADWQQWGSLNNLLPTLAEAAPKTFLDEVEKALNRSPCPFAILFSQENCDSFGGGNYLTGLWWALETLAWDRELLVEVSVILGKLASIDPGGKWSNRPANSLTTIFLPWKPQTIASIDKRKAALNTLKKEQPEIAWKLLLKLLPNQSSMSMGTQKPSWRNTIPDDWTGNVSDEEYWIQVDFCAELAVSMAVNCVKKLNELIQHLNHLPQPSFDRILEHLSSPTVLEQSEDERLQLWTELTRFVAKHKRFSDSEWAINVEKRTHLETVVSKLAPENLLNLHRRLFGNDYFDFYEENGNLDIKKQQAIADILNTGGMPDILKFVELVDEPYFVGCSLGIIATAETDVAILPALLKTDNRKFALFVSGYVGSRHNTSGWEWVDNLDKSGWSDFEIAQYLSYLPFTKETWHRVTEWLKQSEKEYWDKVHPFSYQKEDMSFAIDKLLQYGRPSVAINCLCSNLRNKILDKSQSIKALMAAVSSNEQGYPLDTCSTTTLIKDLQDDSDTDFEQLAGIEWAYLPLLDRHHGASPKTLENKLASNADFFSEVIAVIYQSSKEELNKELSEKEKNIASNAYKLLHHWQTPPGMQPNGLFDGQEFKKWLEQVRNNCVESGHIDIALVHVGNVLFYCPPDSNGLWINEAVADELNAEGADKMRAGFREQIFNSRGVYTVDPTGEAERELAGTYRQKADDVEIAGYHRIADTLRKLSDHYNREAERTIAEYAN
ncbi:MAG: hypothetical protein PHQ03_02440, partial [Methylococcales bacterium]|nr:hypothetical protein [Methylococcales bacterium]